MRKNIGILNFVQISTILISRLLYLVPENAVSLFHKASISLLQLQFQFIAQVFHSFPTAEFQVKVSLFLPKF